MRMQFVDTHHPGITRRRVFGLFAVSLLLGGCLPGAGIAPEQDRLGAVVSTKEVVAKREPDALLARDGSLCAVSPDRFAGTHVGEQVRCAWRPA